MRAAALVLSLLSFVLLAKAHGRQVRLERERSGYHQVVFGGRNPAFVEALWRRDRLRFWPTAGLVVVAALVLRTAGRRRGWRQPLRGGRLGTAWSLLYLPLASAFTVAGLLALAGFHASGHVDPAFTRATVPGSLGLWLLGLAALGVTLRLAFARPHLMPQRHASGPDAAASPDGASLDWPLHGGG